MSKSELKAVEEGMDVLPSKFDTHNGQTETTPSQTIADFNNEGHEEIGGKKKKSLAFHLTFLALLLNVFLYALDATTLGVALPVRTPKLQQRIRSYAIVNTFFVLSFLYQHGWLTNFAGSPSSASWAARHYNHSGQASHTYSPSLLRNPCTPQYPMSSVARYRYTLLQYFFLLDRWCLRLPKT